MISVIFHNGKNVDRMEVPKAKWHEHDGNEVRFLDKEMRVVFALCAKRFICAFNNIDEQTQSLLLLTP